ncbi:UNVERIFIED_CONTAM: hypothetical protein NCL1_45109 [Trichonephila clavipes]
MNYINVFLHEKGRNYSSVLKKISAGVIVLEIIYFLNDKLLKNELGTKTCKCIESRIGMKCQPRCQFCNLIEIMRSIALHATSKCEYIETFVIPLDKVQKALQEKIRALHMKEALNGLFDFNITSKAPFGEIPFRSRKHMGSGLYG